MVGSGDRSATGANRMPMAKLHPILMGKKSGGGGGILAQHRAALEAKRAGQAVQQANPQSGWNPRGPAPPPQQQFKQASAAPPLPPSSGWNNNTPQPPPPEPPKPLMTVKPQPPPPESSKDEAPKKARRKRSRWGAEEEKVDVGIKTLPSNLTEEQRKHYLLNFKIEEISQKLRTGELGIPTDPGQRSPSPEPIYSGEGKRLNTREYRVRKKLEEERHILIKQAVEEIPDYKPPVDYKPPPTRVHDKVFLPQEKNPHINFIGLLIGPRGNTQKKMEKDTGCKIIIRGKGSVKEGKVGRIAGQPMPGEDEPLHAMITGSSEKEVKAAVEMINKIVREGVDNPEQANELRQTQMRELAKLNGTLIEEEIIKCKNCGGIDHKHWECSEQKNVTSSISCTKCGGYGHIAQDCKVNRSMVPTPGFGTGNMTGQTYTEKAKMDDEYLALMAELGGEAPPPPKQNKTDGGSNTSSNKAPTAALPAGSGTGDKPHVGTNYSNFQAPSGLAPSSAKPRPPLGSTVVARAGTASSPRGPRPGGPNRWVAPGDKPKSLMDMNVRGPQGQQNGNQRGQAPWNQRGGGNQGGPPRGPPNQQQRPGGPPPWNQGNQNGPRGGNNYGGGGNNYGQPPPPAGPPPNQQSYPGYPPQPGQAPWQQQRPPGPPGGGYPGNNWGAPPPPPGGAPPGYPPQNQWGAYAQQPPPPPSNYPVPPPPPSTAPPPPPWTQQQPPPPPPPPSS